MEASGEKCRDEFTVIKGPGKPLLGRSTAESSVACWSFIWNPRGKAERLPVEVAHQQGCKICNTRSLKTPTWFAR